jgi:hypothetical protein
MLTCPERIWPASWLDAEMAPAQRHAELAEQLQQFARLDLDIRRALACPDFGDAT